MLAANLTGACARIGRLRNHRQPNKRMTPIPDKARIAVLLTCLIREEFYNSTADLLQGYFRLCPYLPSAAHLDAMAVVHQSVEDAVGNRGVANLLVPARDRQLGSEYGRASLGSDPHRSRRLRGAQVSSFSREKFHERRVRMFGVNFVTMPAVPGFKFLLLKPLLMAMKALHLAEPQISTIRKSLQQTQEVEIGGRAGQRIFQIPDLVAAGFEPVAAV